MLPTFHHVPDRPDATDLGVDGPEIVFQLQLHGSSIDSIRFDSIRSYSMGFDSIHSAFFFSSAFDNPSFIHVHDVVRMCQASFFTAVPVGAVYCQACLA